MARKPRKNTKTYKEFTKTLKALKEQSRYYGRRGISLPSAGDLFTNADASAKNLRQLKKFQKLFKARVKDIKNQARRISKEFGISIKSAYSYLSGRLEEPVVNAEDVYFQVMYEKIDKLATHTSRDALKNFINQLAGQIGTTEAARVFEETAREDKAFEALQHYNKSEVELSHVNFLIDKMLDRADLGPLQRDAIMDFMDLII